MRLHAHHLGARTAGREIGVSASTMSRLLSGETPDIETFAKLIAWLDMDANQFLHAPAQEVQDYDAWGSLYLTLQNLELPVECINALVTVIQIIHTERKTT